MARPKYKNAELEKRIPKNNNKSGLSLSWEKLTDQDMEIVAYYAIQENTVSHIRFYVIIEDRISFLFGCLFVTKQIVY